MELPLSYDEPSLLTGAFLPLQISLTFRADALSRLSALHTVLS
jgi:hypothetical protein